MINKDPVPLAPPGFQKPVSKIDCHTHLRKAKGFNVFTPEERIEFNEVMDISHCVIQTVEKPTENFSEKERLADPRIFAEDAVEICKKHKKHFSWFANIIPDGTNETYKRLKIYKNLGAKGVGELAVPLYFNNPKMEHLIECCMDLELPLLTHMNDILTNKGIVDEEGLVYLEKALKKYPKFIYIGHSQPFWVEIAQYTGDRNAYQPGNVKPGKLIELFNNYENLYGDLSANSGGNAILRDADFGIEFLDKYQDKLLYGTDTLSKNMHYPLGAYLDSLLGQKKITREAYAKICNENAVKLLNLDV